MYVGGSAKGSKSRRAELPRFGNTFLGCSRLVGYMDRVAKGDKGQDGKKTGKEREMWLL